MIQDSGTGIEIQGAGTGVRKVSWTGLARNIGTMKCGITARTRINSSAFIHGMCEEAPNNPSSASLRVLFALGLKPDGSRAANRPAFVIVR